MSYKVAVVLDFWDYAYNGTAVSTRRFISRLEAEGVSFRIFATGEPAPEKETFKPFSLPVIRQILEKMRTPLATPDEAQIESALKDCDLVHVQIPFFLGAAVIKVASRLGIPVVCSFHVQPENILQNLGCRPGFLIGWLYKVFIKHFYSQSNVVICPSLFAERMLKSQGLTTRTCVISNGIPDKYLFAPVANRYLPKKQYQLLSVGRLAKEKHQDLIIRAVARSRFKDQIRLTLVGGGPARGYLEKQANKYLPGRCRIASVSDEELLSLYRTSDLFIHAGEIELEGMSVMEAMASSLPVIVSDAKDSAAKYFIHNKKALFHFPDVGNLCERIDYWLTHPKGRKELAFENFKTASQYAHSHSCLLLENIYREQLKLEPVVTGKQPVRASLPTSPLP